MAALPLTNIMEKKESQEQAPQINPESIKELIAQALSQQTPPSGGAGVSDTAGGLSGWQKVRPQANMQVEKVLVPVELDLQAGKVTVYFQLDGSVAGDPDTLMGTVEGMMEQGIPVKAWRPKNQQSSVYRR